MAIRIRKDGKMVCAAINEPLDGDCYIDDGIHYMLSVEQKVLVTTENEYHMANGGEWWWRGQEPDNVIIGEYYKK
jgi:hypothetical protein